MSYKWFLLKRRGKRDPWALIFQLWPWIKGSSLTQKWVIIFMFSPHLLMLQLCFWVAMNCSMKFLSLFPDTAESRGLEAVSCLTLERKMLAKRGGLNFLGSETVLRDLRENRCQRLNPHLLKSQELELWLSVASWLGVSLGSLAFSSSRCYQHTAPAFGESALKQQLPSWYPS